MSPEDRFASYQHARQHARQHDRQHDQQHDQEHNETDVPVLRRLLRTDVSAVLAAFESDPDNMARQGDVTDLASARRYVGTLMASEAQLAFAVVIGATRSIGAARGIGPAQSIGFAQSNRGDAPESGRPMRDDDRPTHLDDDSTRHDDGHDDDGYGTERNDGELGDWGGRGGEPCDGEGRAGEASDGEPLDWESRGGELVGLVAVTVDRNNLNGWFWYWTSVHGRGRGWTSAAAATVADWALSEGGLFRLELGHRVNNPASGAVARAAGFVKDGTERGKFLIDGQRIDVDTYSRLATDPPGTARRLHLLTT